MFLIVFCRYFEITVITIEYIEMYDRTSIKLLANITKCIFYISFNTTNYKTVNLKYRLISI